MDRLFVVLVSAIAIVILAMGVLVFVTQGHNPTPVHPPVVVLTCGNGTEARMTVEIADSPAEREYGLMNRASMAPDAGMLFVFDDNARRYFWMENTLIPLDMIFISGDLTIVDIHENAVPLSKDIIASSCPCRYVLEVNGGVCAADGIDIGDRVTLDLN